MKRIIQTIGLLVVLSIAVWSCNKVMDAKPVQTEAVADTTHKASQGTAWLQASGSTTQIIAAANTAEKAIIDQLDGGVQVTLSNSDAIVNRSGSYIIIAAPQVGRIGVGGTQNFRCWLTVNGLNVDNSNVFMSLAPNTKDVIISQGIVELEKGDVVNVMISSDVAGEVIIEAIQMPGEPLVPSIIFTMYKVN